MLNAHNAAPDGDFAETKPRELSRTDDQTVRLHIVCLECGATGSSLLSRDGSREFAGFVNRPIGGNEDKRPLKCISCGQSNYELVRAHP